MWATYSMDGCGRERGHLRMEHLRDVTQEKDPYANGYVLDIEEHHVWANLCVGMSPARPVRAWKTNAVGTQEG